jgi:dimethylaniline monooxygenase (N-oxide forming)
MRVAVIGGGPSGLVTLKYLTTAHEFLGTGRIEAKIFEAEADIGGTFLARTYEDAEVWPFTHPRVLVRGHDPILTCQIFSA